MAVVRTKGRRVTKGASVERSGKGQVPAPEGRSEERSEKRQVPAPEGRSGKGHVPEERLEVGQLGVD